MYRDRSIYDKLDKLALDILVDYEITEFPLNEITLCEKMGILLIPYSNYDEENQQLLKKYSSHGFCNNSKIGSNPIIFYNDDRTYSQINIKQTIFHEIKHIIDYNEDGNPDSDDLAEHFGKYLSAPMPHVILHKNFEISKIMIEYNVSYTIANNISSQAIRRFNRYGYEIFEYEEPFVDMIKSK